MGPAHLRRGQGRSEPRRVSVVGRTTRAGGEVSPLIRRNNRSAAHRPMAAGSWLTTDTSGETNVAAHKRLLAAARRGDVERVRKLMVEHIDEAARHVLKLDAGVGYRDAAVAQKP